MRKRLATTEGVCKSPETTAVNNQPMNYLSSLSTVLISRLMTALSTAIYNNNDITIALMVYNVIFYYFIVVIKPNINC